MISAIVLAAGSSTRMGTKNKLTLPYSNNTILETVIGYLQKSNIGEIIVVLGHEERKIQELLKKNDLIFCQNPNHLSGMTSSIQAGIRACSKASDGYLICLSDMPFLTTSDYQNILEKAIGDKKILLTYHENQNGNPVYFSKHFRAEILNHQKMEGCKEIVQKNKKFVVKIEFTNDHILKDIDTLKDYSNL